MTLAVRFAPTRRQVLAGLPALWPLGVAAAPPLPPGFAPNTVPIGPALVTSGQPPRSTLEGLRDLDFDTVIHLVPHGLSDGIDDEPQILARQGVAYVHLPIPFDAPTPDHVQAVSDALLQWRERSRGRRLLVHCQVNLRASTMVFLHRATRERVDPWSAWTSVSAVWTPRGPWRRLVSAELARHGVAFDPF